MSGIMGMSIATDGQKRNERTSGTTTHQPDDLKAKHLRTLGLDPRKSWNPDEVKAAYRRVAKQTHPDAGGSSVEFIAVQNAWVWLRQHMKSSVA